MYDFISIGDTMQDVFLDMDPANAHLHRFNNEAEEICFTYADKIPVRSKHDTVGGNSANAAIALARLQFRTAIYTHVGDDDQGERIVKEFTKNKVSSEYIKIDRGTESNYNTVINLNAERTILIYHVHRAYNLPSLSPAKWVYLSSMGEGFEKIYPDLIDYLKKTKAKLCYQPGTYQLKYGAEKSQDLLKNTKIFFVNKEEAEMYLEREPTDDFKSLLQGILDLGPEIAVITDGPKGAYASDGREYIYLGIIEEAPRIEATGAGDSFSSAFAASITLGRGLEDALRWGQCESSSVIGQIGPQAGLLYPKQIENLLKANPDLKAKSL